MAASQRGLVTRQQLIALGRSARQIDHALTSGHLIRSFAGVYRIGGSVTDDHVDLAAGLLATSGVASHRSSAKLLALLERAPSRPDITVGESRSKSKMGLILHRSADLKPSDVIRVDGLRCTNATRTLIDLGAVAGADAVESALERALYLRLTTLDRLQRRLDEVARRGRPGAGMLRRLLEMRSPSLAPTESELELLIWQILRRHHVRLPERQVKVTVGGRRFILDMAYVAEKLFIEGDGFGVHGPLAAFESDRQRQNILVVAGWRPLRFTWSEARHAEMTVVEQVQEALLVRRPGTRSA